MAAKDGDLESFDPDQQLVLRLAERFFSAEQGDPTLLAEVQGAVGEAAMSELLVNLVSFLTFSKTRVALGLSDPHER